MDPTCGTCKKFITNNGSCKRSTNPNTIPEKIDDEMSPVGGGCDEWVKADPLDKYTTDVLEAANTLLENGDAFRFIVDVWNTKHVGDRGIGEACACAVGATYIVNSAGIHMKPSGQSGKGKSDGSKKFIHLLPDCKKMVGSLSGKAPFYSDELKAGVVVYSDDAKLNEDIISTIKQATTYFQTTTTHHTVNIKRQGETLSIPQRVSWWMTNVDSFDDDQMGNRFLTMDVDAGPKQDEAVFKHQVECHLKGLTDEEVTTEVLICRAIYEILNQDEYHVVIPFLKCLDWDNKDNRRNFQMFIDIIESVALYRFKQLDNIDKFYFAELQDYERAKDIYNSLVATNTTNLSEIELKIMRYMEAAAEAEIMEIAHQINRGRSATHKYLHGKNGTGGLLEKIPGFNYEKVTIKPEGSDRSTHKNIYYFQSKNSKYGLDSFSSVIGICMSGFDEEVEQTKLSLSRLSPTVTPLSPLKSQSKPLSIDIINKYIINISNIYDSGCDSGCLQKNGDTGNSENSQATDIETHSDSQRDSEVTVINQDMSQRDIVIFIKATIQKFQVDGKTPITTVLDHAIDNGIAFDRCKSAIQQMKLEGSIFEPEEGFYRCI